MSKSSLGNVILGHPLKKSQRCKFSSLTGASNILGQDMDPVNAPQCCLLRGQQHVEVGSQGM